MYIKIDKQLTLLIKILVVFLQNAKKLENNIFHIKNREKETLLVKHLARKYMFDLRNPADPYFMTGSLVSTHIRLHYLTHENPISTAVGEQNRKQHLLIR